MYGISLNFSSINPIPALSSILGKIPGVGAVQGATASLFEYLGNGPNVVLPPFRNLVLVSLNTLCVAVSVPILMKIYSDPIIRPSAYGTCLVGMAVFLADVGLHLVLNKRICEEIGPVISTLICFGAYAWLLEKKAAYLAAQRRVPEPRNVVPDELGLLEVDRYLNFDNSPYAQHPKNHLIKHVEWV